RRHTRFSRDWSSDVCSSDLQLFPIGQRNPLEDAPDREQTEEMRTGKGFVHFGDLHIQAFPAYNVIGGLGDEGPVPGTPAFIELEYLFDDLVGIFPLVEDQLQGIHYGKNQVSVQSHGLK